MILRIRLRPGGGSEPSGECLMFRINLRVWFYRAFLLLFCSWPVSVEAKIIAAANCSKAAVTAAYNSASNGDTISVPAGDCSTSNAWISHLEIKKPVTIQGAGMDQTIIGTSGVGVFTILADNARITGFTFDGKWANNDADAMVQAGLADGHGCDVPTLYTQKDWRIDHNKFIRCGRSSGSVLGYRAIGTFGATYGVIDHNTFDDCNGECITPEQDGAASRARSNDPGQYSENMTIYIEDNIFNYTSTYSYDVDNAIDSNSGARYAFRYNTINVGDGVWIADIASMHDCSCGQNCNCGTQQEAFPQMAEVYGNKVYATGSGAIGGFMAQRAGRVFVYNNTVYYADMQNAAGRIYYIRAEHRPGCFSPSGVSEFCFESSGGTPEGLAANRTTLNGALGNDTGCPTVASVSGFPTNSSITVGTEQIDYTGIDGNTLTPCTRGANTDGGAGPRAVHSAGAAVSLLLFGRCTDQPNNSYYWGNLYKATLTSAGVARNTVDVLDKVNDNDAPYYQTYTIQSYAQRPGNWQYLNDATAYPYTPYPYPHPLTIGLSAPQNLRIIH